MLAVGQTSSLFFAMFPAYMGLGPDLILSKRAYTSPLDSLDGACHNLHLHRSWPTASYYYESTTKRRDSLARQSRPLRRLRGHLQIQSDGRCIPETASDQGEQTSSPNLTRAPVGPDRAPQSMSETRHGCHRRMSDCRVDGVDISRIEAAFTCFGASPPPPIARLATRRPPSSFDSRLCCMAMNRHHQRDDGSAADGPFSPIRPLPWCLAVPTGPKAQDIRLMILSVIMILLWKWRHRGMSLEFCLCLFQGLGISNHVPFCLL